MDNLSDIVKNRSDYKKTRESKYKQESRERLSKILKKKIILNQNSIFLFVLETVFENTLFINF